jgi:hypothetical protein
MMFLSLIAYAHHFLRYVLEPLEHVLQLDACNHEQLAFNLCNSRAIALSSLAKGYLLGRLENVRIAKIRTLHVEVERGVDLVSLTCLIQVYVELDTSLENEENLLRIISLEIQSVFWVNFHRFEQWQYSEQEWWVFIREEFDPSDDFSVRVTDDLGSHRRRHISE